MSDNPRIRIKHLYISPGHNYFGHHGREASQYELVEVQDIRCVAGHGIEGDRFFDFRPGYKGQITFFASEVYEDLCQQLGVHTKHPGVLRRNVITDGIDINTLIGKEFEIQGVRFLGTEESRPCYWMDQAFAPGAEKALRGNGGLRAKILTDGILHVNI
ncbi:MOSC domain-containing protein [Verrucomicrobiota bacterium sgz303538]